MCPQVCTCNAQNISEHMTGDVCLALEACIPSVNNTSCQSQVACKECTCWWRYLPGQGGNNCVSDVFGDTICPRGTHGECIVLREQTLQDTIVHSYKYTDMVLIGGAEIFICILVVFLLGVTVLYALRFQARIIHVHNDPSSEYMVDVVDNSPYTCTCTPLLQSEDTVPFSWSRTH